MVEVENTGTSLMSTDQIALRWAIRWAMSCENNIIEVVVKVSGGTTSVPEPVIFCQKFVSRSVTLFMVKKGQ